MAGTRVFIGCLPRDVRERDIEKFLADNGRIREIFLKNGYGFVEFDDARDAEDAVYELNGKKLLGEKVVLQLTRRRSRGNGGYRDKYYNGYSSRSGYRGGYKNRFGPAQRTNYRVIVENLSSRVSWQNLRYFMEKVAVVTFADVHKKRLNEGIVEFASYRDMKTAIDQLDRSDLNGRCIRVREDKTSSSRYQSYNRSRSHSLESVKSRSNSIYKSERRQTCSNGYSTKSRSISFSISPSPARSRTSPENLKSRSDKRPRSISRSTSRGSLLQMKYSPRSNSASRSQSRTSRRYSAYIKSRSDKRQRSVSGSARKQSRSNSRYSTKSRSILPGLPPSPSRSDSFGSLKSGTNKRSRSISHSKPRYSKKFRSTSQSLSPRRQSSPRSSRTCCLSSKGSLNKSMSKSESRSRSRSRHSSKSQTSVGRAEIKKRKFASRSTSKSSNKSKRSRLTSLSENITIAAIIPKSSVHLPETKDLAPEANNEHLQ